MTIIYSREPAHTLWDEILPLLQLHYQEIATYQDIPLDPDVERYNAMEAAGALRCFTARIGDGLRVPPLIGYSVVITAGNLHYRSSGIAMQDVLFVHPEHRRGPAGSGLLDYTETALRQEGLQVIYQHQKTAHPALGIILGRRGYDHVENIWAKRLDKGD